MFAQRSWIAVLLSVAVLAMAIASFLLPWYHIEQDVLTVSSERQFKLQEVRSVVTASSESSHLERVSTSSYDDPPDFLEVGDLMRLETAILLVTIVMQMVFVATCLVGAKKVAILTGALSFLLLVVTWVVFFASIEGAVNSSDWAEQGFNEPISGFIGSSEMSVVGVEIVTSWGPLTGWALLVGGTVAQVGAVLAVIRRAA